MRTSTHSGRLLAIAAAAGLAAMGLLFTGRLGDELDGLVARGVFLVIAVPLLIIAAELLRRRPSATEVVLGTHEEIEEMSLSEHQKRDFVATVSHELRTPLTSIKGYAETLALDFERGDTSQSPEAVAVILRNTDRLLELCGDLLSLAKLEHAPLLREPWPTLDLSREVLSRLEPMRLAKGHDISLECEAPTVYGDSRMLAQVLTNLVENAIRYLPSLGRIEVRWIPEPGGAVLLKVSDNGPGIAPEHHPRLFERFFRIDDGRARIDGGTGLGLAVVKNIVLKHGGKVWIESRLGKGAAFFCHFPVD